MTSAQAGVEWAVRCSCERHFIGSPPVVKQWVREHADFPFHEHVVEWDVPGMKPWSDTGESV